MPMSSQTRNQRKWKRFLAYFLLKIYPNDAAPKRQLSCRILAARLTNWCKSGVYIVSHAVWKIKGLQKTLILRQKNRFRYAFAPKPIKKGRISSYSFLFCLHLQYCHSLREYTFSFNFLKFFLPCKIRPCSLFPNYCEKY